MFVNDTELSLRNIAGDALSDGKRKRPPQRAGTCAVRSGCKMRGTYGIGLGYGKCAYQYADFDS